MRKIKIISSTVATGLIAAASALGSANAASAIQSDPKAPLTVWVDGNRSTQAEAYKAAHPEIAITINTVDPSQGSNTSKIALAVKAGSGIPDVVFLGSPDEISTLSANPINYPLALNDLVPKNVLDGFPAGSLDRCTYNGKIYCLGNDTGQTVLWYNKPLFKEWGYSVPKTFDEFKALGAKLAAQHPGYNLGTVNGRYGVDALFGSAVAQLSTPRASSTSGSTRPIPSAHASVM